MRDDPFEFVFDLLDKYGPMRQVDIMARLVFIKHRERRPLLQRAVARGYLARDLDPDLSVRVLRRTDKKYTPLGQRVDRANVAGPRVIANGASTEPIPPDVPLVGRPGQDDFKQYMRKYRVG